MAQFIVSKYVTELTKFAARMRCYYDREKWLGNLFVATVYVY